MLFISRIKGAEVWIMRITGAPCREKTRTWRALTYYPLRRLQLLFEIPQLLQFTVRDQHCPENVVTPLWIVEGVDILVGEVLTLDDIVYFQVACYRFTFQNLHGSIDTQDAHRRRVLHTLELD